MTMSFFSGRDGFVWWIGVVEDRSDPKALGRVRVRVFGYHTDDKTKLPSHDLPWAICVQPANSASSGGIGSSPTGPIEGSWVFGFWRDPDFMQEPMVLGTIPGFIGSSNTPNGSAPFDYDPAQQRPPAQIEEVVYTGDGTTTEFQTPIDTTDSAVLVTNNGITENASNNPPSNPLNTEFNSTAFEGGTTYTEADFGRSRYASRTAQKVNSLAPWIRDRFAQGVQKFLNDNPDYDCSFGYGYRSMQEQQQLYNAYRSGQTTNRAASPGSSWHNFACAVDLQIFLPDGSYDTGTRGNNYTTIGTAAFSPFGLQNPIADDVGHFYPVEFDSRPPRNLRSGQITVAQYAEEQGISTTV